MYEGALIILERESRKSPRKNKKITGVRNGLVLSLYVEAENIRLLKSVSVAKPARVSEASRRTFKINSRRRESSVSVTGLSQPL